MGFFKRLKKGLKKVRKGLGLPAITIGIGMGLLARIHKGTTATYQRRKVNDETWLPAQVTWTAGARVLLVRRLRIRGISDFSGYRKFTVDTSTTYSTPSS